MLGCITENTVNTVSCSLLSAFCLYWLKLCHDIGVDKYRLPQTDPRDAIHRAVHTSVIN